MDPFHSLELCLTCVFPAPLDSDAQVLESRRNCPPHARTHNPRQHGIEEAQLGHAVASPPKDGSTFPAGEGEQVACGDRSQHGPSDEFIGSRHERREARFRSQLVHDSTPPVWLSKLQQPLLTACQTSRRSHRRWEWPEVDTYWSRN